MYGSTGFCLDEDCGTCISWPEQESDTLFFAIFVYSSVEMSLPSFTESFLKLLLLAKLHLVDWM